MQWRYRLLFTMLAVLVGCVGCGLTANQCRNYVEAARYVIGECTRIENEADRRLCLNLSHGLLVIAKTECGRLPDDLAEAKANVENTQ